MSCDLVPSERPGPHIVGDVGKVLKDGWDLLVAFPPCEHLSKAGALHWEAKRSDGRQQAAVEFFLTLANASHIPHRAIENPAGLLSTVYRKPDQYVNPYMFGEPWRKATGLWLYSLPKLKATDPVPPTGYWVECNVNGVSRAELRARGIKLGARNPKLRARTFEGVAAAMAAQWGEYCQATLVRD